MNEVSTPTNLNCNYPKPKQVVFVDFAPGVKPEIRKEIAQTILEKNPPKDECDFKTQKKQFGPDTQENTLRASLSPKEVCEWGAAAKIIIDLILYGYDAVADRWGKKEADTAKAALLSACVKNAYPKNDDKYDVQYLA